MTPGYGRGGCHSPWTRTSWAETGGSAVCFQRGRLEAPSLPLSISGNQQPASYFFFKSSLEFFKSSLVPTNLDHFLREYIIKTLRKSFNKHSRFWR